MNQIPVCPFCDLHIPSGEEVTAPSPYTGNPVPCCKTCVDSATKEADAVWAEQCRDYERGIAGGLGVGR